MMKIHYDHVGALPILDSFRDEFPQMVAEYRVFLTKKVDPVARAARVQELKTAYEEGRLSEALSSSHPTDYPKTTLIVLCVGHFYGLAVEDFESITAMLDAVDSMDEYTKFH